MENTAVKRRGTLKARWIDVVAIAFLGLLALTQFLPPAQSQSFHRDEARWIHRAVYLRELRHPLSAYWDEANWQGGGSSLDERYRLRGQPPLGSYLFGVGLLLQGRDLTTNGFWNMDRDANWNILNGNGPAIADLVAARRTNAVIGALTVVAVYALGRRLTNPVGGFAGATLLVFHPLMIEVASHAGSDTLLALMLSLAALATAALTERPTWPRALMLGVLLGLGGATKLTPLLISLPLAIWGVAFLGGLLVERQPRRAALQRALGWRLLSLPLVAWGVFVATYPYLWSNPIASTRDMFQFRADGMNLQAAIFPNTAVGSPVEAMGRVGRKLGTDFTALGRFAVWLQEETGHLVDTRGIELALAVAGGVILLGLAIGRGPHSAPMLVGLLFGAQTAMTIVGMRADFFRYHVPVLVVAAVCTGVLAGTLWGWRGMISGLYRTRVVAQRNAQARAPHQAISESAHPS